MNPATWLLYLAGNRNAILQVATSKHALWLGLIFVLSAGFAREYDGEDLLHEPWHLLIPLAASVASSLMLYLLVYIVSLVRGEKRWPSWQEYRAVLQLFWMTAPLAWLYAIPFERFLSPADAVRANLSLLGLVSLWRVLLMTRAVSVLYQVRYVTALAVVMLFADTVVLAVLFLTPLPVVNIMGGIRLTESEHLIKQVTGNVTVLGVLTWPVWLVAIGFSAYLARFRRAPTTVASTPTASWSMFGLAGLSLAVWVFVLPLTQPDQQNRWKVESSLKRGDIEAGLRYMSQRNRDDFPPHWDPPPRVGYGQTNPSLIEVRRATFNKNVAPWVRQIYNDKLAYQEGN